MPAQPKPPRKNRPTAKGVVVGTRAPGFSLPATAWPEFEEQQVSLDDYRDRWLVLLFYPRDFSMVCPTELTALGAHFEEFATRECDILGISTDPLDSHQQWIATPRNQGGLGGLAFPLASDVDGAVCQAYGVLLSQQHVALRGLFIIDPNGVLQYQVVHNLSIGRRADEVLRVLEGLQTGGLCPEGWNRDEPTIDPATVLGPGRVVGQYRIESEIGSGTFGVVFRAADLTLKRTVALKVFRPARLGSASRFLEEAQAAAALNHPNVCTVHAVNEAGGISMIVMEYVRGQSLAAMLKGGKLSPADVRRIGRGIALGMAAAHATRIVHGDLKPGNIMITSDGVAKIMDFGLAHRQRVATPTDDTATWDTSAAGGLTGTPDYMSPEQARSEAATVQSDVFSLGLMLYEMVTGQRAVHGNNLLDVLRQIDSLDAEEYAAEMPEPLATILRRALASDPHKRAITMSEIAELLEWRGSSIAST